MLICLDFTFQVVKLFCKIQKEAIPDLLDKAMF